MPLEVTKEEHVLTLTASVFSLQQIEKLPVTHNKTVQKTLTDPILFKVIANVQQDWLNWVQGELKPYYTRRNKHILWSPQTVYCGQE